MLSIISIFSALVFSACGTAEQQPQTCSPNRSFIIDYEHDRFLKDGVPYQFISGALHYFRVPEAYWEDRIVKMKAAGLTAVETYVPWNLHEPRAGKFDFSGRFNLTEFIRLVQKHDLDFILRMGPYSCGELDNGGLPWWLVKAVPDIKMRTSDSRYLYYVSKWYFKLFPMVFPLLYKNGGPVIMLQVENEYGSFGACDKEYMTFLRDLFRSYVGEDVVLFTVDGGRMKYLRCGFTPGVYPTVDFGSDDSIQEGFSAQRAYAPHGPLVNMEFYPGWLDIWGLNHSTVNTSDILQSMTAMYEQGASFNFYVFHGGTNFGYTSGSVGRWPCTTSYDYDAPLDESGDPTPKYTAIRNHIESLTGTRNTLPLPESTPKGAYGEVEMEHLGSVIDLLHLWIRKNTTAEYPLTFEQLDHPYGFVLYETVVLFNKSGPGGPGNLSVPGIRDRGYVMVDGASRGFVSNMDKEYSLLLTAKAGSILHILVENQGRHTKGTRDPKGLGNVTLDGHVLTNWTMYPIIIEDLLEMVKYEAPHVLKTLLKKKSSFFKADKSNGSFSPSFYYAKFSLEGRRLEDTFLHVGNWSKGQAFINGFNLGRYWPSRGPQVTLYVPKTVLQAKTNVLLLFELEEAGNCEETQRKCKISLIDHAILDKMVPGVVVVEPFSDVKD